MSGYSVTAGNGCIAIGSQAATNGNDDDNHNAADPSPPRTPPQPVCNCDNLVQTVAWAAVALGFFGTIAYLYRHPPPPPSCATTTRVVLLVLGAATGATNEEDPSFVTDLTEELD